MLVKICGGGVQKMKGAFLKYGKRGIVKMANIHLVCTVQLLGP